MRIDPQEQRAADARLCAIRADRLRDSQDVLFVERAIGCAAAMARSSERHALRGDAWIGMNGVVITDQTRRIDESGGFRRLTCKGAYGHGFCYRVKLLPHYARLW